MQKLEFGGFFRKLEMIICIISPANNIDLTIRNHANLHIKLKK